MRRGPYRRRKPLPPPPAYDPAGFHIKDPVSGVEEFISHEELKCACEDEMYQSSTYKPEWHNDPTYNLRRKK